MQTSKVKFPRHSEFHRELNRRVDAWFHDTGRSRSGGARLIFKSLCILAWIVGSYIYMVGFASTWWQATLALVSLGLAASAVGFNIMHDGGHRSYSRRTWVNKLTAYCLDLIGGSSYYWNHKHNRIHHHYTNVDGIDEDIEAQPWLRLAPSQALRPWHRWQHWFAWALYSFLPVKWVLYDDFSNLVRGKVGNNPVPRPKPRELLALLFGKVWFLCLAFVVPLWLGHSILAILALYTLFNIVNGVSMAVVFQLAHCVEEAELVQIPRGDQRLPQGWLEHQLATTVNFAPGNPIVGWYVGGLNYQVEHHLFPRVSHVHYPALAKIVAAACEEHGVRYRSNPGVWQALVSHCRYLKRMGKETWAPSAETPLNETVAGAA